MAATITLRFAATCRDCGADLPAGTVARFYGRGRVYGTTCHANSERPVAFGSTGENAPRYARTRSNAYAPRPRGRCEDAPCCGCCDTYSGAEPFPGYGECAAPASSETSPASTSTRGAPRTLAPPPSSAPPWPATSRPAASWKRPRPASSPSGRSPATLRQGRPHHRGLPRRAPRQPSRWLGFNSAWWPRERHSWGSPS